jgi:uncharacterized membrane protein
MLYRLTNGTLTKVLIILELFINIICYKFLPDKVGVHFDSAGNINGTMPKLLFIVFLPLLTLLLNLYYKKLNNSYQMKSTLFTVVFFVINLVTLFINLR